MAGIGQQVFNHVTRIKVTFRDDIGNGEPISGTGFWIEVNNTRYFVTNRHNVDPTLKLGASTKYRLEGLQIQLRKGTQGILVPITEFTPVENFKDFKLHNEADVAVLKEPRFNNATSEFLITAFGKDEIAELAFFSQGLQPMDIASFIGFPGLNGKQWWDERWQFPIARTVNIASYPSIPFTHSDIKTGDVSLVSGLSFSGSSGSPIISHQKGIQVGGGLQGGGFVPPKVIGIMSGHWWEDELNQRDAFNHSGLSYYTRSTSILELVD